MTGTSAPVARPERTERPSLWRDRGFVLLWGGQGASEIGSSVTAIALPLVAVVFLKCTPFQVGVLTALNTLPFLLVALPAGAIVDRRRRHRVMMWCDLGRFLALATLPLATVPGLRITYPHLLAVALVTGVLGVFFDVAYRSYLPVLLEQQDLAEGNRLLSTTESLAHFAGPSIGGVVIGWLGAARAIALDAASYGVSALSLALIRRPEPEPVPRTRERTMRREIREGLAFVLGHPVLRRVMAASAAANFFGTVNFAVEMLFLVRVLHASPTTVGWVLSLSALGGASGALIAPRLAARIGTARIIWFALLVIGLPAVAMPLARPGWGVLLYAGGLFFFMMSVVTYNVAQLSYRQAATPPELLGRMNASIRFIVWGSMPFGAAVGGLLGSHLGIRATMWVALVGGRCAGLFILLSPLRRLRDLPTALSE